MEWMLDFRAHACFQMLQLFRHSSQFVVGQRLPFEALHGNVPRHGFANIFGALFHALVTGVAERGRLVAVQQRVRFHHVGDVASCADDRVHQAERFDAIGSAAGGPELVFDYSDYDKVPDDAGEGEGDGDAEDVDLSRYDITF
jgi:hypothetical protein